MDFIESDSMPITMVISDVIVTWDMLWLDSGNVNLNVMVYLKLLELWELGDMVHKNLLCPCRQALPGKPGYLHMVPVQRTSKSTENGSRTRCGLSQKSEVKAGGQ